MSTAPDDEDGTRRQRIERWFRLLAPLAIAALAIAAWDLVVRLNQIPPYILPGPGLVVASLVTDWPILGPSLLVTLKITGLALLAGVYHYGEELQVYDGFFDRSRTLCPQTDCPSRVDAGLASTGFALFSARVRLDARFALGLVARWQFDAAPWNVTASGPGWSASKGNDFADLLLMLRLYVSASPRGFLREGVAWSWFVGAGVGQIAPSPAIPTGVATEATHVRSGPANVHAGLRGEYGVLGPLYVAGEVTAHLMAPEWLFNLDLSVQTGLRL